jgi:excinuclease UvrABC nuclease subunit
MRHIQPIRFTQLAASSSPDRPGVYILWVVSAIGTLRPIYVGVSKTSIRQRLTSHFNESHNHHLNLNIRALGKAVLFCWLTLSTDRAKRVETYLIQRLRPAANISENT